ncbi:MAG TPA: hypothetical protein VI248_20880 [Kineosporiaceae bacterium]
MPHLPHRVRVRAEDGQTFADVGQEGVGVRLVGVAEDVRGAAVHGRPEHPVAQVGRRATAGPEVVRGPGGRDRQPRVLRGEDLLGHRGPGRPLRVWASGGLCSVNGRPSGRP